MSQFKIEINTTDVSCKILRRLGVTLNLSNIEKVKIELDNLLLKYVECTNRGSRLIQVMDSLDLFADTVQPVLYKQDSIALMGADLFHHI